MATPANTPSFFPMRTSFVDPVGPPGISLGWITWLQQVELVRQKSFQFFTGTNAQRLAQNIVLLPSGSIFYAADTKIFYVIINGAWHYLTGVQQGFAMNLPVLGPNDFGYLFNATDFAHCLQWIGTQWQWGPGENGSGYIVPFPVAPITSGWQACDGTANVATLQPDGTQTFVTVPVQAGFFYRQ